MFWLILGILFLLVTVVATFIISQQIDARNKRSVQYGEVSVPVKKTVPIVITLFVGILISVLLMGISFVVTLSPGELGRAYQLDGSMENMKVGYNFVAPWARMHVWNGTMQVFTFSQGETKDNIYGAQTTDKDYIEVVASMGAHIDSERLDEYIALYGNEQISSEKITKIFKTISRNSVESTIGTYSTEAAMENKMKISDDAEKHFVEAVKDLPIVVDYFKVDDLVAPEDYETAIKEQAKLRMDKEKATLQRQINEEQANANKAKADGEATVLTTQASASAAAKKIEAENAAAIAKIQADNEAAMKIVQAESDARVRELQAEANAVEITTKANAEAEAIIKQGEAEAAAISAQGEAYKQNPQLIDLKKAEIEAEVQGKWAEKWSGYSFEGMSGLNFANLTDILKDLISSPSVVTPVE